MLARLALRNVRRSARDYGIYFVTILLGVSVFYAFNSIPSQRVLFDLKAADFGVFSTVNEFMGIFSVVVACVLGFLVVYSNRFLIRRRRYEFGMYLLLGMTSGQVARVVLMETVSVGLLSLVVGLGAGIALSQVLSFATAALFQVDMAQYRLVLSGEAIVRTVLCFALIFAVAAAFNVIEVRRCRLATLLSARPDNQRIVMRNPLVSLAAFVVSIVLLVCAYQALIRNGLVEMGDDDFKRATVLMLAGTLLLFWSLSGFVIAVAQHLRRVYCHGLAMFDIRQFASKVNTAFVSLWVICVPLFFAITVFSEGMGLASIFSGDLSESALFDAGLTANIGLYANSKGAEEYASTNGDIAAYLSSHSSTWNQVVGRTAQVDLWALPDLTYGQLASDSGFDARGTALEASDTFRSMPVQAMSLSHLNAARALAGRAPLTLAPDQYLVDNTSTITAGLASSVVRSDLALTVSGTQLHPAGEVVAQGVQVAQIASETCLLVLPDAVIDTLKAQGGKPFMSFLDIDYREGLDPATADRMLETALGEALPDSRYGAGGEESLAYAWPVSTDLTANTVRAQSMGTKMTATYLAVYIGFVLLVATAAILAVQQLSETSDSTSRYRTLAKIGCDRRMILGSLRRQVLVYFLAPLAVAACHATCAIAVSQRTLFSAFGIDAGPTILMAALATLGIYGMYLVVTYLGCRSVVCGALGRHLLG